MNWKPSVLSAFLAGTLASHADAVLDWNAHWEQAVFATVPSQPVAAHARFGAILHVAIFDAVNGIARAYTPYAISEPPPPGARQEAAAVKAAHTVLKALYPASAAALDQHLADSMAAIPGQQGNSQSIARGLAWGKQVAERILALRATDGWSTPPPPYFGSLDPGRWRSIAVPGFPDGTLPAVFTQNAILTPFTMTHPAQFRPGPPYGGPTLADSLASPQYAADFDEVKAIGSASSTTRTSDQTELAKLWQAIGPIDENRAARSVVPADNTLVDNARLFALINMAGCDALVASSDSKFAYELWRPYHAIRHADQDGNAATVQDPAWTALILAPRFPEYVSNHASITGAYMRVLALLLGDEHTFTLSSPNYPSFTWTHARFSDAADQAKEARIWGGIHFRHACDVGQTMGLAVAEYVVEHFLLPLEE